MPNPPRRLGAAGRRLWTTVHGHFQLTITEGVRLARACDLADAVARIEELSTSRSRNGVVLASVPDSSQLDHARRRLSLALQELGVPEDLSPDLVRGVRPRLPKMRASAAVA
jgi:hypothetical protein